MKPMVAEVEFVTIRTAAKMLGKSVRTIRSWIHRGKLTAVKDEHGYRWLILIDDVKKVEGKYAN